MRYPPADLSKRIPGYVRICDPSIGRCRGSECTFAHGTYEQRCWNTILKKQRQGMVLSIATVLILSEQS